MKLIFDKDNARVVSDDDKLVVLYTNEFEIGTDMECGDEVFEKIVELFNNGRTLAEIDRYLIDSPKCTQEAREAITETLDVWFTEEQPRPNSINNKKAMTKYIDARQEKTTLSGETEFSKFYSRVMEDFVDMTRPHTEWDNVVLLSLNSTTGEAVFEVYDNGKVSSACYVGYAGAEFNPKTKFIDSRQEKTLLDGVTEFKTYVPTASISLLKVGYQPNHFETVELLSLCSNYGAIFKATGLKGEKERLNFIYFGKAGAEFN